MKDERKPGLSDIQKIAELFERCVQLQEWLTAAEAKMARIESIDVSLAAAARAEGRREGIEAAQRLLKKAISEATENADARLYWSAAVEIIDEARIRALSAPATTGASTCQWQDPPTPQDAGGGYCGNPMPCSVHGGATTVVEGTAPDRVTQVQIDVEWVECAPCERRRRMESNERCPFPGRPHRYGPLVAPPSSPKGGPMALVESCTCRWQKAGMVPMLIERNPTCPQHGERPRPESACECDPPPTEVFSDARGTCPKCRRATMRGPLEGAEAQVCGACRGKGVSWTRRCHRCGGTGEAK